MWLNKAVLRWNGVWDYRITNCNISRTTGKVDFGGFFSLATSSLKGVCNLRMEVALTVMPCFCSAKIL